MSIVSVDNIQPIGSGTSVTVNSAATLVVDNINSSGVVTATTFYGDGSYLTGISGGGAVDKIIEGNTEAEVVDTGTDGHFKVTTEGTERLRIDSAGNLSLGKGAASSTQYGRNFQIHDTGTSGSTLHLTQAATGSSNSDGFHLVYQTGDIYHWLRESGDQVFATGGSERLRITSGGDLRLGLNSVANQTDSAHHIMTLTGKSGQTGAGAIAFKDPSANTDGFIFADSGNLFITADYSNATADSSIRFRIDGSSEKLRITSDGNVGINTTAPQNGAHVQHYTSTTRHQSFQSSDGDLAIVSDNNSNPVVYVKGTGTADLVNVFDNTTEVFTIKDGGNVDIKGAITANGSFYQEDSSTGGNDTLDKTITFDGRGVFLALISFSLGRTTTDFTRNIYSLGLFTPRSNGATWTAIQQDLNSTHVGNFTISDTGNLGALRVQKSAGTDNRNCAFRIDVLSSDNVEITVTDT